MSGYKCSKCDYPISFTEAKCGPEQIRGLCQECADNYLYENNLTFCDCGRTVISLEDASSMDVTGHVIDIPLCEYCSEYAGIAGY